jgi:dUTPase
MSALNILHFVNKFSAKTYAVLYLSITNNNYNFMKKYITHIQNHNFSVVNDIYPKAGFDLLIPTDKIISKASHKTIEIPLDVKCKMMNHENTSCGYFIFPAPTISKTPLILESNNYGIIDAGYSNMLMGKFRNLDSKKDYIVKANTRLLQIVHPSLCPIYVKMVNDFKL